MSGPDDTRLTPNEIALLMEALDLWVKDPHSGALLTSVLGAAVGGREHKDEAKDFMHTEMERAQQESTSRRDRCILLQAKLIRMKQLGLMAQELTQ